MKATRVCPVQRPRKQRATRLLTVTMTYDDVLLLVGLVQAYFGPEVGVTLIRVSGSRRYVWDDLTRFLEHCPRLDRAQVMTLQVVSTTKSLEIDFRRRTTRLLLTGADAAEARRYQRRITNFLMSTRPRLWPSYSTFFEAPLVTVGYGFALITIGYLYSRPLLVATLVLAAYILGSIFWFNPTRITFKDRTQMWADKQARLQMLTIPISVMGGLLGIISTAMVISAQLH